MTTPASVRLAAAQQLLAKAEAQAGLRQRLTGATAVTDQPTSHQTPPELLMPVPPALIGVFPEGGVRRGTAVQVSRSVSVLLAMAAAAARVPGQEVWSAVVGMPDIGMAAAAEAGMDLHRTVVVPAPGADAAAVIGAVIDGFDVVVLGQLPALGEADRRRLGHRLRTRESVLFSAGGWPGAQVSIDVGQKSWFGIGSGDGALAGRDVTITSGGRGQGGGGRVRVRLAANGAVTAIGEPVVAPSQDSAVAAPQDWQRAS